jgi:hypothetical protein
MITEAVNTGNRWVNGEKSEKASNQTYYTILYSSTRPSCAHSEANPTYMEAACRASCGVCDPRELDLGLPLTFDGMTRSQADGIMAKTKAYMDRVTADDFLSKALPNCKNRHEKCAHWAALGEVSSTVISYSIDSQQQLVTVAPSETKKKQAEGLHSTRTLALSFPKTHPTLSLADARSVRATQST